MGKEPPRRWRREDLEAAWEREALLFGREGIPAREALELFGGAALARACQIDGTFDVAGNCFYLTKEGAEMAAGFCNVMICREDYSADDLRQDLRAMGLSLPDAPGTSTKTREATKRKPLKIVRIQTGPETSGP